MSRIYDEYGVRMWFRFPTEAMKIFDCIESDATKGRLISMIIDFVRGDDSAITPTPEEYAYLTALEILVGEANPEGGK